MVLHNPAIFRPKGKGSGADFRFSASYSKVIFRNLVAAWHKTLRSVFWGMSPCNLRDISNVSDEPAASIISRFDTEFEAASSSKEALRILCLWFHASLLYINNYPKRCNTKQSSYYSASSLYIIRVSTTPVIRSTQNCNYSIRCWSYFLCSYLPPTWPSYLGCGWQPKHVEWTCRIITRLLCVASLWIIINI